MKFEWPLVPQVIVDIGVIPLDRLVQQDDAGMATIVIQPPSANFATTITTSAVTVVEAPTALMTRLAQTRRRFAVWRWSRNSRRQCTTIPVCDMVNVKKRARWRRAELNGR